ncbi:MAG: hypothetical protein UY16_C0005G0012 [Candidatus Gottesmanbacteria bacterium GW2011_GWA2_47_9]|uniref:Glycosyltransferase RgtA/B/C/D-like domain-containing protein n=2 Tax=Microgenomates group TaxID=1794810 RepID=A0A0G0X3X3_9BACT|nr:MAG: hypothetical protein UU42_C0013G0011 [Candidatus Woesebacteria bacterium GW2011_GWA1_41_13b]KKU88569.1 MAG: hypothetical protein UY16_C0005G0012 [Candidatus Gottesmanbacteria bacterium GW2011_GWA2_47_9]
MKRRGWLTILLLLAIALFAYRNGAKQFFLQDEWQAMGLVLYYKKIGSLAALFLPYKGLLAHFNPLTTALFLLENHFFHFWYGGYAWISVFTHLVNTALLYVFVLRWGRKQHLAFSVAALFAVYSISHQAVTWISGGNGLMQATTLFLLSLHGLHLYVTTRKRHFLLFTTAMFFLSLFFKEDVVFLFLGIPSFYFIMEHRPGKKSYVVLLAMMATFVLYVSIRLLLVAKGLYAYEETVDVSTQHIFVYPFRAMIMPIRMLTQSLIPELVILTASRWFTTTAYPQFMVDGQPNPFISETIVADFVSYMGTIAMLGITFVIYRILRELKETGLSKLVVFSIILITESALSYIFVPGRAGFFSILPSRYLYIASIGASIFVSVALYAFWTQVARGQRKLLIGGYMVSMGIVALLHYGNLQHTIQGFAAVGTLRKSFLTAIRSNHETLPKRVVVYTKSDTVHYGSPNGEYTLPVQSGFGQMLLVWYDATEHFPACLFEKLYLYERLSQEYRECGARGFGYFREKDKLLEAVREFGLPRESIIGFSYSGKRQEFEDITGEVQKELFP